MLHLQLVVVANYMEENGVLIIYTLKEKVTQSQHVEQIIEVLSLLNNENTVVQIIQKVSKSSEKEVLEIITWLLKNHIVYDSRELYKWFHKVSQYPDQFISWEQVSYNLNSEIEKKV